MRVAVTGGAGFIGSRLIQILISKGYECLVADNLSVGLPIPVKPPFVFEKLDIRDREGLTAAMVSFRPEAVVHLAAIHHIPTCELDPSSALEVNVVGTQNVLEAATKAACAKVVLASSGAVYDWTEGPLVEERSPVKPHDVYSLSKASNEQQLRLWAVKTDGVGIVARIFNTIGKNDPNGHLIPDIVRQIESNSHCLVRLGNVHSRRDYIYVEDTAACLSALLADKHLTGWEVFNLGTGVEHDVCEVVECIARLRQSKYEIEIDPSRVRRVDRSSQLADITKATARLGWKPIHRFEDAVRLTIQR